MHTYIHTLKILHTASSGSTAKTKHGMAVHKAFLRRCYSGTITNAVQQWYFDKREVCRYTIHMLAFQVQWVPAWVCIDTVVHQLGNGCTYLCALGRAYKCTVSSYLGRSRAHKFLNFTSSVNLPSSPPAMLTIQQKEYRIEVHQPPYNPAADASPISSSIITGIEIWVYAYDFETKQQSSWWRSVYLHDKKAMI